MSLECERKYIGASLDEVRARLMETGATHIGIHFETNFVFENAANTFLIADKLVRLRLQEFPGTRKCFFTIKLPATAQGEAANCKLREELETRVGDFDIFTRMLAEMGFMRKAIYEKVRDSWQLVPEGFEYCQPIKIDLDFLPFCHVVEIEGFQDQIEAAAMRLGIDKLQISTKSYHKLHQEWLQSHGFEPVLDIIFSPQEKLHLRKQIGLS